MAGQSSSGCRFGNRVLSYGRWPVASVSEWPGSPGSSTVACRRDLRGWRRRDTRSDAARPRGVARPRRVVRGDRNGCRERLRVQPTCLRARHPPPLPGHTARGRLIGSLQQACQYMIICRRHCKPRPCERAFGPYCTFLKFGRAPLPRTRVVCIAVTDPADGSLRWCILRPPRMWEAGRTSNPTRLRT